MRTGTIEKFIGETPLEALERFRKIHSISREVPLAYAGRLDPMAEGRLLVLVGETCKHMKRYTALDKEYVVEVLLGVSTDSGDLLGLIKNKADNRSKRLTGSEIEAALTSLTGSHNWEYPVFSSKTVRGKPLFQWYYEGGINTITIPKTDTNLYSLEFISQHSITVPEFSAAIESKIRSITTVTEESKKLGQNFRRKEILSLWSNFLATRPPNSEGVFTIVTLKVSCSSGSYMRTLSEKFGNELNVPACAYSIHRTRIGKYRKIGPLRFWFPSY